jgi:hypothetical protein
MNTTTNTTSTTRTLRTGLALLALAISTPTITTILPAAHAAPQNAMQMATTLSGTFVQVTHATKGTVTLSSSKGKRTVRLSSFESAAGPQLKVYLVSGSSKDNASIKKSVASGKFVSLGTLKSLKGNQSYAIPSGSKLGKGASIVIWCDKFDVAFGSATLS